MQILPSISICFLLFRCGKNTNWEATLDADKAGAASNAEDFTKQFMSQMFGGGQTTAAVPSEPPPPIPIIAKPCKYFKLFP